MAVLTCSSSTIHHEFPNTPTAAALGSHSHFHHHIISSTLSFPIISTPSFINSRSARCRCRATTPTPPPPEPPTGNHPNPPAGPTETLASLQDRLQIFFAVLFWMALFFWASAWDRKNPGKPNKGSRFRR